MIQLNNLFCLPLIVWAFFANIGCGQSPAELEAMSKVLVNGARVTRLLDISSPDVLSTWIESRTEEKSVRPVQLLTERFTFTEITECYQNGRVCGYSSRLREGSRSLSLEGTRFRIIDVRGAGDLTQILNRPLTGYSSNANQELKVVQLRHQLSDAVSRASVTSDKVEICTGVTTLIDPQIKASGFMSVAEVTISVKKLLANSSLVLKEVEKTPDGRFIASCTGECILEYRFFELREAPPKSAFGSEFFLGKERKEVVKSLTSKAIGTELGIEAK